VSIKNVPQRCVVCNVPYDNLVNRYANKCGLEGGKKSRPKTEFVIYATDAKSTPEIPLGVGEPLETRVECKYQSGSGTVILKLLYAVMDLQYGAPEKSAIMLVGGREFEKLRAQEFLSFIKSACDSSQHGGITWNGFLLSPIPKKIVLMTPAKFENWCNRAFYKGN
jgi:hypothetical protein